MRPEIASIENSAPSCSLSPFPSSLALPIDEALPTAKAFTNKGAADNDYDVMTRSLWVPLLAGLIITLLQLAMAIGLLAPEGSFSERYPTLVQAVFWQIRSDVFHELCHPLVLQRVN
jgi:hypothetical protein